MKIVVEQNNKRIKITFQQNSVVGSYEIAKAEDFLGVLDRFIKKRKINFTVLKNPEFEFSNAGFLTERVIKAIVLGLGFHI